MISELNDDEILEFLMTSDFTDEFNPDELKYLLLKWRYFFRVTKGKYDTLTYDFEGLKDMFENKVEFLESEINNLRTENASLLNKIDFMKSKKLTLKERISGKINFEDED